MDNLNYQSETNFGGNVHSALNQDDPQMRFENNGEQEFQYMQQQYREQQFDEEEERQLYQLTATVGNNLFHKKEKGIPATAQQSIKDALTQGSLSQLQAEGTLMNGLALTASAHSSTQQLRNDPYASKDSLKPAGPDQQQQYQSMNFQASYRSNHMQSYRTSSPPIEEDTIDHNQGELDPKQAIHDTQLKVQDIISKYDKLHGGASHSVNNHAPTIGSVQQPPEAQSIRDTPLDLDERASQRRLLESQTQIINTLVQKLEDVDHRLRSHDRSLKIFEEMTTLKKDEQHGFQKLFESQIEELHQKQARLESQQQNQLEICESLNSQISQTLPKLLQKTQEKIDKMHKVVTQEFKAQLDERLKALGDGQEEGVSSVRALVNSHVLATDSKINDLKNDVGNQMHEMCSMVEQLAGMTRQMENTLAAKKPEIESASLNIANLQRKIDEQARLFQTEFATIKKRQYELTQLYSTNLDLEVTSQISKEVTLQRPDSNLTLGEKPLPSFQNTFQAPPKLAMTFDSNQVEHIRTESDNQQSSVHQLLQSHSQTTKELNVKIDQLLQNNAPGAATKKRSISRELVVRQGPMPTQDNVLNVQNIKAIKLNK